MSVFLSTRGLFLSLFIFLMWSLLGIETCHARFGETLDECTARYGPPLKNAPDPSGIGEGISVFKQGGFVIVVVFLKKIVQMELYCNQDGSDLSDSEKKTLLDAEVSSGTWEKYEGLEFKEAWRRGDGATAILSGKVILFVTQEFLSAGEAKNGANGKKGESFLLQMLQR